MEHPPVRRINPCAILVEEIQLVIAYRTASDRNRNLWYKKLTWEMVDKGIVSLSESTVYRILYREKLLGKAFKEKGDAGDEYAHKPEHVHHHWHIDIAYVVIARVSYYLVLIVDGYSRYLLSWELMTDMTGLSVELFTQATLERYPGVNPMIIHDHGPQFVTGDFKGLLRNSDCIDVPTRIKHPETNGKVERLIGVVRQEALRPGSPAHYAEARKILDQYVEYYNHERLHAGIRFLRPVDVFTGKGEEVLAVRREKLQEAKKKRIEKNVEMNAKLREAIPA
jgi:transposase InsO family protein